ncbi:MAG: hypothetical protein M1840_003767 [Geoglossum simile]|nr:MAG: hypothetical protein M1840_003767 [Geoglossum simile]
MSMPPGPSLVPQLPSSSPEVSHEPTSAYSRSVPAPPRIVVPPPAWALNPPNLRNHQRLVSSEVRNAEFLRRVTSGDFTAPKAPLEWKYEWRRRAQRILPFIYLGPIGATKDRDFLERAGVTLLLAVRNTRSAQAKLLDATKVASDLGITSHAVDVDGSQELIAAFPRTIQLINDHLSHVYAQQLQAFPRGGNGDPTSESSIKTGKVLVFCESGSERSATVVAAYLMAMYGLDLVRAIQTVQSQRFCAVFDEDMKNLLLSYATILDAQRDVARSAGIMEQVMGQEGGKRMGNGIAGGLGSGVSRAVKRNVSEAYGTDMGCGDAEGQIDSDRFGGREGYAPFQDRML